MNIARSVPVVATSQPKIVVLYYQDDGQMFSPQISRRRRRIAMDGVEYWLVRVPKR